MKRVENSIYQDDFYEGLRYWPKRIGFDRDRSETGIKNLFWDVSADTSMWFRVNFCSVSASFGWNFTDIAKKNLKKRDENKGETHKLKGGSYRLAFDCRRSPKSNDISWLATIQVIISFCLNFFFATSIFFSTLLRSRFLSLLCLPTTSHICSQISFFFLAVEIHLCRSNFSAIVSSDDTGF